MGIACGTRTERRPDTKRRRRVVLVGEGTMHTLWTPAPARCFSADDLLAAAKALHCQHVKRRTIRTYVERGLLDHPTRDWPGYGGGSSDGWWPLPQFSLWQGGDGHGIKKGQQHGRHMMVFPGLQNTPTAGRL